LASAFAIFEILESGRGEVTFHTKSGPLVVERNGEQLSMNFPADDSHAVTAPPALTRGLRREPEETRIGTHYYLAVFPTVGDIVSLEPDMNAFMELDRIGVVATAPGDTVDFVSRFFGPKVGVPEDPVTGSAHCLAAPYWAERLGKRDLRARQLSRRGGEVGCRLNDAGTRVLLSGMAVLYMRGEIKIR
jgi:predicted PhzF superfamily epimerase YddE/YHI9